MLAGFMEEKYALSLARAVSVNPAKMENILSGEDELSIKILNKIAAYFFIPLDLLIMMRKTSLSLRPLSSMRTCSLYSAMMWRTISRG